jgi:hypothetical protein
MEFSLVLEMSLPTLVENLHATEYAVLIIFANMGIILFPLLNRKNRIS